jgi:hypothetical protein
LLKTEKTKKRFTAAKKHTQSWKNIRLKLSTKTVGSFDKFISEKCGLSIAHVKKISFKKITNS